MILAKTATISISMFASGTACIIASETVASPVGGFADMFSKATGFSLAALAMWLWFQQGKQHREEIRQVMEKMRTDQEQRSKWARDDRRELIDALKDSAAAQREHAIEIRRLNNNLEKGGAAGGR